MLHQLKRFSNISNDHKKPLILFCLVAFFWTIFDSIMTYATPLLLERQHVSMTAMGFIIGSSSVTGAFFDFVMTKVFKNSNFRRILLFMFALCFLYPILLWNATTLWLLLFTMAVWAIYCDLYGFGLFNFVGKFIHKQHYSESFSMIQVFRSLARIIAPLIIGFLVADAVGMNVVYLSFAFLFIGLCIFLVLLFTTKQQKEVHESVLLHRRNFFHEIHLWTKIGKSLILVLYTTFFLFLTEAFFWTLAPLFGKSIHFASFGGLFLAAYLVPPLFMNGILGGFIKKYGKKRTAFTSILIGSLYYSSIIFFSNPYIILLVTFIGSCFLALATPAINGIFSDTISEAESVEIEIEGLADASYNIGYIVGPILAGIFADMFSVATAFSMLGIIGVFSSLVLLYAMPKHITVSVKNSEL